jgi:hypothetical protein
MPAAISQQQHAANGTIGVPTHVHQEQQQQQHRPTAGSSANAVSSVNNNGNSKSSKHARGSKEQNDNARLGHYDEWAASPNQQQQQQQQNSSIIRMTATAQQPSSSAEAVARNRHDSGSRRAGAALPLVRGSIDDVNPYARDRNKIDNGSGAEVHHAQSNRVVRRRLSSVQRGNDVISPTTSAGRAASSSSQHHQQQLDTAAAAATAAAAVRPSSRAHDVAALKLPLVGTPRSNTTVVDSDTVSPSKPTAVVSLASSSSLANSSPRSIVYEERATRHSQSRSQSSTPRSGSEQHHSPRPASAGGRAVQLTPIPSNSMITTKAALAMLEKDDVSLTAVLAEESRKQLSQLGLSLFLKGSAGAEDDSNMVFDNTTPNTTTSSSVTYTAAAPASGPASRAAHVFAAA